MGPFPLTIQRWPLRMAGLPGLPRIRIIIKVKINDRERCITHSRVRPGLEEKFGVSAAAPVAVAAAPASGEGSVAEEKTDFDIELSGVGDKKINVIKVIREITSLGHKEAKDLADGAPNVIKEAVPANEANEIKAKLEEAGATVTLK